MICALCIVLQLGTTLGSPDDIKAPELPGNISTVQFLLYTRENPGDQDHYVLDVFNSSSLQQSPFSSDRGTYFVFHGMSDNAFLPWILDTKTAILGLEDANIFAVDYSKMVPDIFYVQDVENVYKVANLTANVIDWLHEETGLLPEQIHLIGHSLGAHVVGVTGQYVTSGEIDRITGLDPAGPLFYDLPNDRILDASDASFVDIIHTNSVNEGGLIDGCYGLLRPLGHVDFYPNGGTHQPGHEEPFIRPCLLGYSWSHDRSTELWVESITAREPSSVVFKSWPCTCWEDYELGVCQDCGPGCLEMGYNVQRRLRDTCQISIYSDSPFYPS
ncbi:unnamed protein product, partial [Meganyctiphanes norvegica]